MRPILLSPLIKHTAAAFLAAALGIAAHAQEPTVIASDNASAGNYPDGTWNATTNGGTGFGAWSLPGSAGPEAGFNGNFIGTGSRTNSSNETVPIANYEALYSDGVAFSIYAGGNGAFQDALRPFALPMTSGQTLSFSVGFSFDNGNKGISLNSGTDGSGEVFNFNINAQGYSWSGNGSAPMTTFEGVRDNGVVINFTFTRTSSGFSYTINSTQDANLTQSGDISAAGLGSLKFYISGAGGGDPGNLYFNNLQIFGTPAPEGNRTVTFNVDMSVQENLGFFNSENGSVLVVGSFNGWSTENGSIALVDIGNGVYSGNGSIFGSEGSTINYKFLNTTPGAPNSGYEEGADRTLVLGPIDEDQTVPVVYFSNQLPMRTVTFSVNMSEQISLGNFDPANGTVSVVGEFNGWTPDSGAIPLASSGDGIYSGNGSISGLANDTVAYKFFNSTEGAPNSGYEAGEDRSLILGEPGVAQEEPLVSYRMPSRPTIVSASTSNGTVGNSLAYQIEITPPSSEWEAGYALTGNTTLPDGLTLNTSTGLISGIPTGAGNTTVQLTATNVGGTSDAFSLDFSITQSAGAYDSWAAGYDLSGDSALPASDPDNDSLTNQQEFAFGTNPTEATAGLLTTSSGVDGLTVVFLTRPDLTYNVQTTDNLSTTPFSDNATVTGTVADSSNQDGVPTGYTRREFTVEPGGGRTFYRVTASEQNPN